MTDEARGPTRGPLLGRQGWHLRDCWQFWANGEGDAVCICSEARAAVRGSEGLDVERLARAVEAHNAAFMEQPESFDHPLRVAESIAAEYDRLSTSVPLPGETERERIERTSSSLNRSVPLSGEPGS